MARSSRSTGTPASDKFRLAASVPGTAVGKRKHYATADLNKLVQLAGKARPPTKGALGGSWLTNKLHIDGTKLDDCALNLLASRVGEHCSGTKASVLKAVGKARPAVIMRRVLHLAHEAFKQPGTPRHSFVWQGVSTAPGRMGATRREQSSKAKSSVGRTSAKRTVADGDAVRMRAKALTDGDRQAAKDKTAATKTEAAARKRRAQLERDFTAFEAVPASQERAR